MRRFLAWATLENVGKAFDLALKLAAIVAVFAALSFFKAEGNLEPYPRCWTPIGETDVTVTSAARLTASQAALPIAALRTVERAETIPLGAQSDRLAMRIGCTRTPVSIYDLRSQQTIAEDQAQFFGHSIPGRSLTPQERKARIALLLKLYPDAGDDAYKVVPELAIVIAGDPLLNTAAIARILRLVEHERKVDVLVEVANDGKADALKVTVPSPQGYTLIDAHPITSELPGDYKFLGAVGRQNIVFGEHPAVTLPSNKSAVFIFEQAAFSSPRVSIADIVPKGDTSRSIDFPRQLELFGLLLLIVLVPLVVRDVRRTKP